MDQIVNIQNNLVLPVFFAALLAVVSLTYAGQTVQVALPDNPTAQQQLAAGQQIVAAANDINVSRIEIGPGVYHFNEGLKVSGHQVEIVGTLDVAGPTTVLQFSSLCDGYQKTADNTYTLPQTAELIALFQSDPKMPQGRWRRLLLLKDVAQITTTPGSFHWAAGMLTVHPYDNADPALTIEIPDVRMGILAAYGHVIASNLHIRGTRNTGTYGFSGILQLTDCLLSENGWNGVDTSRQSSVLYKRIASVNNGNDGYGVHRLGVGTFTQCYAAHNGDDGFSPHEEGIMRLTDCVSEHNADRGTVAVQGSMMTLKRCQLYHNGGQNLSLEAGAEGVMQQVIADTSGTPDKAQPNIRVLNDSSLLMYQVFDRSGQPVKPALYGNATTSQVDTDTATFDVQLLSYQKLLPEWFFTSKILDIQP
jgi:hypothetical protein